MGINTENLLLESEEVSKAKIRDQQNLENAVMNKNYEKAVKLALKLDRPNKLWEIVKSTNCDENLFTPIVVKLSDSHLDRFLKYISSWNTHSKMATFAQKILNIILGNVQPERLSHLRYLEEYMGSLLLGWGHYPEIL